MSKGNADSFPNRAAAYVRMSTEHQQYSTSNQMDVIREYAKRRGLEIVCSRLCRDTRFNWAALV